jgi:ribosomal protein S3
MFDFFKKPKPINPHTREAIEGIAIWAERKKLPKGSLGLVSVTIDESDGFNVTITTTNPAVLMGEGGAHVQHLCNHLRGYMSRKLKITIEKHNIFETKTDKP